MVKKGTGKNDNKSSRFSFGSVIKYFRTSRGRMVFETGALLAFCAALLISGSVSLAWCNINTSVKSETGSVNISELRIPDAEIYVHKIYSYDEAGRNFTFEPNGEPVSEDEVYLPDYDGLEAQFSTNSGSDKKGALLLEFSFGDFEIFNKVKLTAKTDGVWSVSDNNSLSNCVQMALADVNGNTASVAPDKWYCFVELNSGRNIGYIEFDDVSFSNKTGNKLWIVVKYYEDAVNKIVDSVTQNGSDVLNLSEIKFKSDIYYSLLFSE